MFSFCGLFFTCMLGFLVIGFHFTSHKVIIAVCSKTVIAIRSVDQHAYAINSYPRQDQLFSVLY